MERKRKRKKNRATAETVHNSTDYVEILFFLNRFDFFLINKIKIGTSR